MFLSLKCFGMSLYEKICDWHIGAQEMCPAELKAKRLCIRDFIALEALNDGNCREGAVYVVAQSRTRLKRLSLA